VLVEQIDFQYTWRMSAVHNTESVLSRDVGVGVIDNPKMIGLRRDLACCYAAVASDGRRRRHVAVQYVHVRLIARVVVSQRH